MLCPTWQCGDKKATSHLPCPSPHSSQSFAAFSTAHSEPQPGFKHLGIVSPGVPEPTEQLVVLSWTHSRAPCSARELAPGLGAPGSNEHLPAQALLAWLSCSVARGG